MILKCGLSPTGVRPAVCIDECQVLLRIKHYSSVISPAQNVQVLDAVFGWTGFQPSYANSTWQWLTAAFDPKYRYIAFTLISAVPLRHLLSTTSELTSARYTSLTKPGSRPLKIGNFRNSRAVETGCPMPSLSTSTVSA